MSNISNDLYRSLYKRFYSDYIFYKILNFKIINYKILNNHQYDGFNYDIFTYILLLQFSSVFQHLTLNSVVLFLWPNQLSFV